MEAGRRPTVVIMIAKMAADTVMAVAPPRSNQPVQRARGTIILIAVQPERPDQHRYFAANVAMAGISMETVTG